MVLLACAAASAANSPTPPPRTWTVETEYARVGMSDRGLIVSIAARESGKEYVAEGQTSPILALHENGKTLPPVSAAYDASKHEIILRYPNDAVATVQALPKGKYVRLQLLALERRGAVDNVVWGPIHTTISGRIGDIIGVVRDEDWAIGMMGLDDNTIAGPVVDGDCYGMGYYIHSPDPEKYPVPPQYKEGQWFNIGGDGVSDVAFYSHPEEYFQQVYGNGARLEPGSGSAVVYHARDRRKPYTHFFSLLPGFKGSRPRHQVSDPVDVDFIGSGVALYACPDEAGLSTIEDVIVSEGLPHIMFDGKWVRDPSANKPDIAWSGPHDKLIEYANALGLKGVQDEGQGEYYANPADHWLGKRVGFADGRKLSYKEFTDEANRYGIKYGLHTLCLFLQGGRCTDVTPVPSEHLQTVLRTKLARDISATDTNIEVTDSSFLAEDGTWPMRDGANYLRIGGEMLKYTGISETAPYILKGIVRGHASTAQPHKAGDELVKLQVNCYNGFCPDMQLMPDYADYYATVMHENGMQYIDFDGLESTLYQNHGYYGVRRFFRRLFDTYSKLTGGKSPRVMGSCVFSGGWEYMSVCNVGGDNNMFDPVGNRWGIEGKDIRNGFANSYFPATFGIQSYHADWSAFDAENLQAKSIGWDATYMLGLNQNTVEKSGEKEVIFKAYRAWEEARAAQVFTKATKQRLRDLTLKFHLERTGATSFLLSPVKETTLNEPADNQSHALTVSNPYDAQPLQFALRFTGPAGRKDPNTKAVLSEDATLDGVVVTLPDGRQLKSERKMKSGEFIICRGNTAYVADSFRKKTADLQLDQAATLPKGEATLHLQSMGATAPAQSKFQFTLWAVGESERLAK